MKPGNWHDGPVTDPVSEAANDDLAALVGEWVDWAGAGRLMGVSATRIRALVKEHQLAAAVPVPGEGVKLPAELFMDGDIVKGIPGLITLLHDGRYDDREILTWLFTPDETLPGRPIDALRENRGSEVKRRAQAMSL